MMQDYECEFIIIQSAKQSSKIKMRVWEEGSADGRTCHLRGRTTAQIPKAHMSDTPALLQGMWRKMKPESQLPWYMQQKQTKNPPKPTEISLQPLWKTRTVVTLEVLL